MTACGTRYPSYPEFKTFGDSGLEQELCTEQQFGGHQPSLGSVPLGWALHSLQPLPSFQLFLSSVWQNQPLPASQVFQSSLGNQLFGPACGTSPSHLPS